MRIIVDNVSKQYKNKYCLKNFSYTFEEGKCYMILGANGSGKTTLLKGIMGLLRFDKGKVINDGFFVGYVPEKMVFPTFLTIYDFLFNICEIKKNINKEKIREYLADWGLSNKANSKLNSLSKGMLQKVLIIQALIVEPTLYIFDEVLNGLDTKMQNHLLNIIREEKNKGKTIIITSHYPKIYEEVIDEVITLL